MANLQARNSGQERPQTGHAPYPTTDIKLGVKLGTEFAANEKMPQRSVTRVTRPLQRVRSNIYLDWVSAIIVPIKACFFEHLI